MHRSHTRAPAKIRSLQLGLFTYQLYHHERGQDTWKRVWENGTEAGKKTELSLGERKRGEDCATSNEEKFEAW